MQTSRQRIRIAVPHTAQPVKEASAVAAPESIDRIPTATCEQLFAIKRRVHSSSVLLSRVWSNNRHPISSAGVVLPLALG